MSRTRSPGSFSIASRSRPWLVSSHQSAKEKQSLRLVEPRRYLKDDTGSGLQAPLCAFEGEVLRLTDHFELDPTAGRAARPWCVCGLVRLGRS